MHAVQILVDTAQGWVDHDRHLTLSALPQTCRSLGNFFLSHLWERIELYCGMRMEGGVALLTVEDELLVQELSRQLETPSKQNPDLTQHAVCNCDLHTYVKPSITPHRIMNVVIEDQPELKTILTKLADSMLLPNLHSSNALQIQKLLR